MLLRQTATKHGERLATIVGTTHDHLAADRKARVVGDRRHKPCALRILWVAGDCKAKTRRLRRSDRLPAMSRILRTIDAAMMLHPQRVGLRRALHEAVRILRIGIVDTARWQVVGGHASRG